MTHPLGYGYCLEAHGYHVVAVQNPLTSLADDVAATRRAIALLRGMQFAVSMGVIWQTWLIPWGFMRFEDLL